MVAFARDANPQATVLEGDLNSLPFDDQQFDGLFSWYSIIHTPPSELVHLAQEFHRVLRPGGIALLGFQAGRGARSLRHAYGTNITLRAYLHHPGDVEADLARSGLNASHTLVRRPRHNETHFQATVVAARPRDASSSSRASSHEEDLWCENGQRSSPAVVILIAHIGSK